MTPESPKAPASMMSPAASGIVIKYRVMRLSVMVIGPPAAICFSKRGITLPRLPRTLPKRTAHFERVDAFDMVSAILMALTRVLGRSKLSRQGEEHT